MKTNNSSSIFTILAIVVLSVVTSASEVCGQFDSFFDGSCTINGVTTPIDEALIEPEVSFFNCLKLGIPLTGGLASVQFNINDGDCDGFGVSAEWNVVSTPDEIADWGITRIGGLSPPFPLVPCPPTLVENYGTHRGNQSTFSISIGGLFNNGPLITRVIGAGMTWQDTIEIVSDKDVVIALPLHASGSVVAGESFGTAATEGFASLGITGTAAGQAVDECVSVTSVSTIPEQDSINVTELIQIPLQAGVNTITVDLTAMGTVRSTAQGAGLIAGSATAGVDFNNTLNFGRFVASNGGPLPAGLIIASTTTDLIYEDTTTATQALENINVFRGVLLEGDLAEAQQSDDMFLRLNPGFILNDLEAPVWVEFFGTAPNSNLVNVESQAGTPGLTYTVEAWNWTLSAYEEIGAQAEQFNVDQTGNFPMIPDHVDSDGSVRTRVGWRQTGFTINFPWEVRIDQVIWN